MTAKLQANQVVVGAFGHIYVAPVGTAMPATIAAAITAMATSTWKDLGYVDENGVSFTAGKTEVDILAWQTQDPIRKIITARTGDFTASLLQINSETLPFALDGGVWTPGTGNTFVFEFPKASDAPSERAMLVDIEDGTTQLVLGFYRATVSGNVTPQFVRGSAAKLPLTVSLLADATAGNIGRIVGTIPIGS
jgi:hypothetical protein